ncbi:MAG TPA: hypothetical protein VEB18_02620 [Candidatus Paceibacterota bacterium]|nr:hypothetical protein [Candidatus Paceibacterota bacterium]
MRRKRRPPRDYIIAGVLCVVLLWLLWLVWGIFQKEERARHAAEEAQAQLEALTEREATLRANLADLRTERGQEASFRETYGVARPGEEVIIVVPPGEGEDLGELPWWRTFLGWFGL